VTGRELLDELAAQESRLVFDQFDEDTAWALGVALRDAALAAAVPVAISIRRNGQRLFHAALPGSSADNDGWLERKSAVVDRYGRSSLRVGEQFRVEGGSFDADARLHPSEYAAHGGAFPILVRGTGCVGTVAVSGLPELDDHQLVVEILEALTRTWVRLNTPEVIDEVAQVTIPGRRQLLRRGRPAQCRNVRSVEVSMRIPASGVVEGGPGA
jgi:uncharacterized protein (UPF0303 family)